MQHFECCGETSLRLRDHFTVKSALNIRLLPATASVCVSEVCLMADTPAAREPAVQSDADTSGRFSQPRRVCLHFTPLLLRAWRTT